MDLAKVTKTAEGLRDDAEKLVRSTLKDESKTDSALDAAADAAKKFTGGKFDDKIDAARDAADTKVGSD